ncbi:MAG: WecB/TagA/CpsF family glycosyltransferase [Bacteroidaceae bacterium]|nr:WecB/TagA/CpsF family glycosyltransferase [Bacteroidaceae bacterium]
MDSITDKIICSVLEFSSKAKIYTFLNPVSYLDAQKNEALFLSFDGIFADGALLVKAIEIFYKKPIKRYSFDMTSVASMLFSYAQKERKTIYIVASKQEQIENFLRIVKGTYPNLIIIGFRNGYFADEKEQDLEIQNILKINPDFVIVGMGIVNQEKFLLNLKEKGFQGVGFSCGGFVHQTAGKNINYYPSWINKCNLRFAYRMYKEPHTRKRYIIAGFKFPAFFIYKRYFEK